MPYNPITLDLDLTGENPSNFIADEPHTLSNRPTRAIATSQGPFYAESVIVRNGATALSRHSDYQVVELHQEATLKTGKEVSSVILILNQSVPSNVTVSYQAIGGPYSHSDETIANMYQSVIADNRPVDWTNIFNKPTEFNPSIHRHLLEDVYGFEPVVDYLERIKRAITLGQADILITAFNAIISKFKCGELPKVLPSSKIMQYDSFLYFLSRRKMLSNIWIDIVGCNWMKGRMGVFQIDTTDRPIGETLHWEFYKSGAQVSLFSVKKGTIVTDGTIQTILVYIPADSTIVESQLYLGVKENETDQEYLAVTYIIDIQEALSSTGIFAYTIVEVSDNSDLDYYMMNYGYTDELRLYAMLTRY